MGKRVVMQGLREAGAAAGAMKKNLTLVQSLSKTGVSMKLQDNEDKALNDASLLIKYAAESPKTLPENIMMPIALAWKAREDNAWSPDVSTKFWTAYSALCDLLKPVTLETIAASQPVKSLRWLFFGAVVERTLAETAARRYRVLLFVLLAVAVTLGFVASAATRITNEIKDFTAKGNTAATDVAAALANIKGDLDQITPADGNVLKLSLDDSRINADTRSKITALRDKLQEMYYDVDMMTERANRIAALTSFFRMRSIAAMKDYQPGDLSRLPTLEAGYANVQSYYQVRRTVSALSESEGSIVNLTILYYAYNALVPLLFGSIGACTYVLRLISDQIRESSFSATSPVRHSVRVLLGTLAGFAVGLGGIATSAGLTTAAVAFVAGYSVEPVFATMDGIAEKFRRG
jgi:hypothetical protein